jgi:hypothetical protein
LPESNRYSFLLVDFLVVLTNPSNNDISEKLLKNKHPKLSAHDRFLEQPSSGMLSQKTGTTLIRYTQLKDWNNPHQVRSVKRLEQPSSGMLIVKRLEQLSSGMLSQKTGTTLIRYSHSQKTRTTLIRYAQSKD